MDAAPQAAPLCPHAGPNLDHASLKSDPALFAQLKQIGTMPTYDDEPGSPQTLVMANCHACHTTLCRVR